MFKNEGKNWNQKVAAGAWVFRTVYENTTAGKRADAK